MQKRDLRSSAGIRILIIGFIAFVLLIPTFMIRSLILERMDRRDKVTQEISQIWGNKQTLVGPILSVPYKYRYYTETNEVIENIYYAHFLPETLRIDGEIIPELRNRGIYEVVVYNCQLTISGQFAPPNFNELGINQEDILFDMALVSIGISDMKGVNDTIILDWNGELLSVNPGIETNDIISTGVSTRVKISNQQTSYKFETSLNLNGSGEILFSPVGKETKVKIKSDWTNPRFTGEYLPTTRELNEHGFTSEWKILHVSRTFPQQWKGTKYQPDYTLFGVSFLLTVDEYQKTMRTVKYALMFIVLTFMTLFLIEILGKKALHPIQYLFVGFALLVFYTLLLSFSEYIAFKFAYLIASSGVILLISFYTKSVLENKTQTNIVSLFLVLLYGYLYITLQLQDYALLMGSMILFVALAIMMFLTRKIDWFTVLSIEKEDQK